VQVVRVDGLNELRRDLRQSDKTIDRRLSGRLRRATRVVLDDAKARVPVRSGAARSSLKSGVQQRGAYIKGGKDDVPYYGWLDFGSRRPQAGRAPWANSGKGPKGGRFIYPALGETSGPFIREVRKAIDQALQEVDL
jgi:hypothetical protein